MKRKKGTAPFFSNIYLLKKRRCPLFPSSKKSISLIELMLTVAILSIGIVMVLRSFLTLAGAFGYASNKLAALQFLDGKMAQIQEEALGEEDVSQKVFEDDVKLGNKNFSWNAQFLGIAHGGGEFQQVKEVKLTISWKEGRAGKGEVLSSYVPIKVQEKEEDEK